MQTIKTERNDVLRPSCDLKLFIFVGINHSLHIKFKIQQPYYIDYDIYEIILNL